MSRYLYKPRFKLAVVLLVISAVLLGAWASTQATVKAQVVDDQNKKPTGKDTPEPSGPTSLNPLNWMANKISGWVLGAISWVLLKTLRGAVNVVLELLDRYVFLHRDFVNDKRIKEPYQKVRQLAEWLFGLVLVFSLIRIMISGVSVGTSELRSFIPRVIMGAFIVHFSNQIVNFFVGIDWEITHYLLAGANSIREFKVGNWLMAGAIGPGTGTIFMIMALLAALVGFFTIAVILVIRYVALGFLVCFGTMAGVCFLDERLSRITIIWWRVMLSTVFLMSMEALLLMLFLSFGLAASADSPWQVLGNCASVIAMGYLAVKIPAFFLESAMAYVGTAGGIVSQASSGVAQAAGLGEAAKAVTALAAGV